MRRPAPQPPDQAARERILADLDTTLLVEAAAGTGKTASLVGRMVALLAAGRCTVDQLAAVTFTRKAAAELRARFTAALERAARAESGERGARLAAALARPERCFIGTIHSFCARLLRERPVEAGVPAAFEEMDDEADALLRDRAWEEFAAALYAAGDPGVVRLADLGVHLNQLKPAFRVFASYPDVEEWPAPEVRLGELAPVRRRLDQYLARIRALLPELPAERCSDQLMARYRRIELLARHRDLGKPVHLLEVLGEFDRSHGAVEKHWPGGCKGGLAKREKEAWETFREEVAAPFAARWRQLRYAAAVPLLRAALEVYDRLRAEAGCLNFQDLLLRASRLLATRPGVRAYFRERFTHLLVDEFQDTDPLQAEVLLYLTADDPAQADWRRCRPVPGSLFVVGDPKQSIYRFRRADIVTYQLVKGIVLGAGGAVVELDASFRTLPELVAWGNGVFAPPTFPETESRHAPAAHPLAVGRPAAAGAGGPSAGVRTITVPEECGTGDACADYDARRIARFIRHALDAGLPLPRTAREAQEGTGPAAVPGDFLIVTWSRRRLQRYAAALQELGVPHVVSGGSAWDQVEELRLLAGLLRALVEPENPVALVGVLRGGLFGVSDEELYDFKTAGGRFAFGTAVPEDRLAPETRTRFEDAFSRLRRHAGWLRRLPPVAALERIAADLGLPLRALSAPGGDGRAGSIGKAFALLRAQSAALGSVAGVADLLEGLIDERAPFDGLPARAVETSVVRVMNLHKVKGLEAPVVFLADPGGKPRGGRSLHVDRSRGRITGYLSIERQLNEWLREPLAQPHGWEEYEKEERRFEEAERTRLLYVAATRAGAMTVVTRRAGKGRQHNPWEFFSKWLAGAPELEDPGPQRAPAAGAAAATEAEIAAAEEGIAARWRVAAAPTCDLRGAKELAISAAELHRRPSAGEHGTEWGTAIHFLLEVALREPGRALNDLARAALDEQGLPASRAAEALAVVAAVRASALWRRAAAAQRLLVEVPFEICLQPGDPDAEGAVLPTLVRGVVDLAFREAAGWAIVDWKTDAARGEAEVAERVRHYGPQVRLYARLWERIAGEPVAEKGLYFTALDRYVTL